MYWSSVSESNLADLWSASSQFDVRFLAFKPDQRGSLECDTFSSKHGSFFRPEGCSLNHSGSNMCKQGSGPFVRLPKTQLYAPVIRSTNSPNLGESRVRRLKASSQGMTMESCPRVSCLNFLMVSVSCE